MSMIEHVVLFKIKDDVATSEVDAMVNRVNSLLSLQQVLHLTMGPLHRFRSFPSFPPFTHILHARYSSKDDLNAYTVHPSHVAVVNANAPFCVDTMALDWVVQDFQGGLVPPPGSAMRVTFFKLKEGLGDEVKDEVLRTIREIQSQFNQAIQLTCGQNFSPGRAKGFSIASLAVFPGLTQLEALDSDGELGNYHKNDKIKDYLETWVVLDYVLPSPTAQSAS